MDSREELMAEIERVRREWDEWIAEESPSPLSIGHAPYREEIARLEDEIAEIEATE